MSTDISYAAESTFGVEEKEVEVASTLFDGRTSDGLTTSGLEESLEKSESSPWTPSLLRTGAICGLLALMLTFWLLLASWSVLWASNHDRVENWKFPPSVYLASFTAISNKALAFAAIQGAAITFWLRALDGTSLGQLQRDWSFGLHVYRAIIAGRHFNLLALACICATLVAVDGPLLQHASSIRSRTPMELVPLTVSITPEIPYAFSGVTIVAEDVDPPIVTNNLSPAFAPIARNYSSDAQMAGAVRGCTGMTCSARVRAPALAIHHCDSFTGPINYKQPISGNWVNITEERAAFVVGISPQGGPTGHLSLFTLLSDQAVADTCIGSLTETLCFLRSAIAEYNVTITDNVISFAEPPSHPKIIALANNTALFNATIARYGKASGLKHTINRSTLGGIAAAASWDLEIALGFNPPYGPGQSVTFTDQLTNFAFQHITNFEKWSNSEACAPAWSDPTDAVMASLNKLAFWTGIYTAQTYHESHLKGLIDEGLEIQSTVLGTPISAVNVFETNFAYFAGAVVLQICTILAILITFYGYWRLGRNASLSPLEIAKAFGSPLLDDAESNSNGREIARIEGDRRVQYGFLRATGTEKGFTQLRSQRLLIAEVGMVVKPNGECTTIKKYGDQLKQRMQQLCHNSRRNQPIPVQSERV